MKILQATLKKMPGDFHLVSFFPERKEKNGKIKL